MGYIDMAKQIEQEGIEYYRSLAGTSRIRGLAGIFEFLMREEQRHYEVFDAWQKKERAPEIEVSDVALRAKDLFSSLRKTPAISACPQ